MGIALWILSGLAAFGAGRATAAARPEGWSGEAVTAVVAAFAAGIAATALDFGGWNEPDWRAGAFALVFAFAVVGCIRVARLLLRRAA